MKYRSSDIYYFLQLRVHVAFMWVAIHDIIYTKHIKLPLLNSVDDYAYTESS